MRTKIRLNDQELYELKRELARKGVTVIEDTHSIKWQLANRSRK